MNSALFHWLNDPQLVARFQKFFGVLPKPASDSDDSSEDSDLTSAADLRLKNIYDPSNALIDDYDPNNLAHGYNLRSRKYQTHRRSASEFSTTSSKDSTADSKDYVIKYSFFYYLFNIGAGLGNEMFYCCFFPYWFWNVDGYVCRRLVLTWCIIMYIGQALKDIIRYVQD